MPRPFGLAHIGWMLLVGVAGWATTLALTVAPLPRYRVWELSWQLAACLALVGLARLLAFRVFGRVRIALDSAFYVATAFIFGAVPAAWLILITLTVDAIVRVARGTGPVVRGGAPLRHTVAWLPYSGGLPALVLLGTGALFDDAQLYPVRDLTLAWLLPLFFICFVGVHYFLAGSAQWLSGGQARPLWRGFFFRTVTAEMFLAPLSLAMVLGHMHEGMGLFLLLGATGLLFNGIFRRGAIAADKLHERVEALSTLNKVGRIIAGSLERDALLQNLSRETVALVGCDSRFMIGLLSENRDTVAYEVFNEKGERYKQIVASPDEGLSSWVMQHRAALNLGNVQKQWRLYLHDFAYNDPRYHSWLGVPLVISDEVIGVISLQSQERYAYTLAQVRVLTTIADQAAVAIENARLYELATVDGLTGLFVRRYFDQRIVEEWDRSERYGNPFSVGMFDLDDFKRLNDTYGHQTGDEVLRAAAAAVRSNMRSFDIPARYGGEEFVFILPRTDVSEARRVGERVRRDIETLAVAGAGGDIHITASIGIAAYPAAGLTGAWELVARSDQALYQAKKQGKNCVVVAGDTELGVAAGGAARGS